MESRRKAIILLSGGLDSTVAAWMLRPRVEPVLALTADYGQKAARRELAAAYALAQRLGIPHRTVFLPFLREAASGPLMDPGTPVPEPAQEDLDDVEGAARESAAAVWIPNRNGVLIAVAAAWAEAAEVDLVACGFNREEAATFPDNSREFLEAQNRALSFSTRTGVRVVSPTIEMTKEEIAGKGRALGVPFELCWPCYLGGQQPCGKCESCRRYERALVGAGVPLQPEGGWGRVSPS